MDFLLAAKRSWHLKLGKAKDSSLLRCSGLKVAHLVSEQVYSDSNHRNNYFLVQNKTKHNNALLGGCS